MAETAKLIPGFLTNVELDQALGSSRTRQRWEAEGILPRGLWIKGFQKRVGIYPEILLARVVGGMDARESEDAVREAMHIGARLIDSPLFGEIARSLQECLTEFSGLNRHVLDRLGEHGLLEPLQEELERAGDSLQTVGIDFRSHSATLTAKDISLTVVDGFGGETVLPVSQLLGIIELGEVVVVEEVKVGARTLSYVLPVASQAAVDPEEEMWIEMFASVDVTPIVTPVLADDHGDSHGGDVVRRRGRVRIELPRELYAGANSMASRSRAHA